MTRSNLPWIVAVLAFPVVGLLFFVLTGSLPGAALVGLVSAVALGVGIRFAEPFNDDLDAYQADARRRVAKVLSSVKSIQVMAGKVTDPQARAALEEGCTRIPELIDSVQARDPSGVSSTAAKLNVTTGGIETTLAQYLKIQQDPDLYSDAPALLAAGREGFLGFRQFVVGTFQQLNAAEVVNYKATLAALQPLEIRQLTS